ncbi:MAG: hypothetical protein U1C04_20190 [Hydrogenophaga sp.]|uniref:hypothetical protein n=1 Tax=Hydrogenophaga sp. TaxID=1904254 RepID=UPI002AB80850|nr:hypothetical protein [Hydrogenophaga sp.]MDZ4283072.1 hypothetical protein [Hydrogenophaga sp.]
MLYELKDKINRAIFDHSVREILKTAPLQFDQSAKAVILTQLQHKDVKMFLLAVKSFASHVPIRAVHILSDGTLTPSDIAVLDENIPSVVFYKLDQFRSTQCPRGACWERLLTIAEIVKENYVVQLDGDTLTLENIPEVVHCIEQELSFTLGTSDGQVMESMCVRRNEASKEISRHEHPHIQLLSEASFDGLTGYDTMRYSKGCAGFAGFAKGSFSREFVENVSLQMESLVGSRWREWGSEQVMSNIVVANTPGSLVLPHPKYGSCENLGKVTPSFIHFIGYCRFKNGCYSKFAKKVMSRLAST